MNLGVGGVAVPSYEINKHDYAFFLQVISPVSILKEITIPMLWAPMYDGERFNYANWKIISRFPIKVLAFSLKIADWARLFSIPTMVVQYYYLEPPHERQVIKGTNVLFWYRGSISLPQVLHLLNPKQIDNLTILDITDNSRKALVISNEDRDKYHIHYIKNGFIPRDHYMNLLHKASVFIAPRKKEGIGAFTEALALGKCVVAYDDAVHNEYITHGVDGLLFTELTDTLDLSNADKLGEVAWRRAKTVNDIWMKDKEKIVPFLMEENPKRRSFIPICVWVALVIVINLYRSTCYYLKCLMR